MWRLSQKSILQPKIPAKSLVSVRCKGAVCVSIKIIIFFIKIGQTFAEMWQFNGFQNGERPPSWICEIQIFWRSERLRGPFCISVQNFVKISQTIAELSRFLWFFKMAAAAILDFQKFKILTVDPLLGANMRHDSKFHQNRWNGRNLTAFSKWRPSAILDSLGAYRDHPRWPLGGLYRCAKFG